MVEVLGTVEVLGVLEMLGMVEVPGMVGMDEVPGMLGKVEVLGMLGRVEVLEMLEMHQVHQLLVGLELLDALDFECLVKVGWMAIDELLWEGVQVRGILLLGTDRVDLADFENNHMNYMTKHGAQLDEGLSGGSQSLAGRVCVE
jgi:hypothetical protein